MWLKAFKAALAERDPKRIGDLLDTMPPFDSLEQMQEAAYLIQDARSLLESLKHDTIDALKQLQKNRDYLKATRSSQKNRLDLSS